MVSGSIFNDNSSKTNKVEASIRDNWIQIDDYTVDHEGLISVNGSVKFPEVMGYHLKLPLKFKKVTGDFDCSCLKLKTLLGCPLEVGGDFNCTYNQLSSLEYAPLKVKGNFILDSGIPSLYTGFNCNFTAINLVLISSFELMKLHYKIVQNLDCIDLIFKYQHYYEVWSPVDKKLNDSNLELLLEDICDGLK
jgi:hypothetical protein